MFKLVPALPSGRQAVCGAATASVGGSTARETRARRGRILALGECRLQLPGKKDGQLVRSAEFTQSELELEIERLSGAGEDTTQFVLALKMLALSRGGG